MVTVRLAASAAFLIAVPAMAQQRTDLYGDPLPDGAVARLGVPRLPMRTPIAFAADGKSFVGISGDSVIRFDATTGKMLGRTRFPDTLSQLSADGRTVGAVNWESAKIWDAATKRLLLQVASQDKNLRAVLSPDGRELAAIDGGRGANGMQRLSVWDLASGEERVLESSPPRSRSLLFSPDSRYLLVANVGVEVKCWDLVRGEPVWSSKDQFHKYLFAPNGRTIFQVRNSGAWSARNAATGEAINDFRLPTERAYSYAEIAPDNRTLVLPTKQGVIFWDMKEGKELHLLPDTERETSFGSSFIGPFSRDGKSILTNFGVVQRWDLATGKPLFPDTINLGHTGPPSSFAFSPDGKWLASGSWEEHRVRIWDMASGRLVHTLRGHTSVLRTLQFTPDSTRLITGAHDSTVRVWDVASGREIHCLHLHDGKNSDEHQQVGNLRISGDGKQVVVIGVEGFRGDESDCTLSIWNIIDGKRLEQQRKVYAKGLGFGIIGCALTADNAVMLDDGRFIDAKGSLTRPLPPRLRENERLHLPCLAPDDRLAAECVFRRETTSVGFVGVLVWEVATGRTVTRLPVNGVQRIAFGPTGTTLVTVGAAGIQTWELRSSQAARTESAPASSDLTWTFALAVSPDGSKAATGCRDYTILLWDVKPPAEKATPLTAADSLAAWADLAQPDGAKGFAAVCRLTDDPTRALALLKDRLRPATVPPADEVQKLVCELGSTNFQTRENAEKSLRVFGDRVEAPLREALKATESAEAKRRIEAILASFALLTPPEGETLRGIRAVWVLERIGTPDARQLLDDLAKGAETVRLTRESKTALGRLGQ